MLSVMKHTQYSQYNFCLHTITKIKEQEHSRPFHLGFTIYELPLTKAEAVQVPD